MHDLVHDLALYIAKDDYLLQKSNTQHIPENVLHLSFNDNDLVEKSATAKLLAVRSILLPDGVGVTSDAVLNAWVSCKYLRFLDLSGSTCEVLPRSIGKLKHLRYLSLDRNVKLKRLPRSICMLQNLQGLSLSGCTELEILPKGLRKLVSLQTLVITTKQSVLPESDIASLSSLKFFEIFSCHKLVSLFVGIKFPTLRTLMVSNCESLKSLPLDGDHFPQLESFFLKGCPNLDLSMGQDQDIQNSNLRLKAVHFEEIPQLVTLPRWLQQCAGTLQALSFFRCDEFEVLPQWLSSSICLRTLSFRYSPKLVFLPSDIHCLTALEFLQIEGCPRLSRQCKSQEYWNKISHIQMLVIVDDEESED